MESVTIVAETDDVSELLGRIDALTDKVDTLQETVNELVEKLQYVVLDRGNYADEL